MNGLNQAINDSRDQLSGVRFVKEKKLLNEFMGHIAQDTNLVVYGLRDTMQLAEDGIVKELIVYEDLEAYRVEFKRPGDGETIVKYVT